MFRNLPLFDVLSYVFYYYFNFHCSVDQTTDAPITRSSQRLLAITNGLSLRSGRALESRDDDSKCSYKS